MHIPDEKLRQVVDRFEQIEARMGATTDGDEIVQLGKDYAELKPIAEGVRRLQDVRAEMADLELMMDDPEMAAMAKDELQALKDSLPALEHEVSLLLLPKDKDDQASIVLEIRAGTGGDEAAIFAGDLFAMYQRYAALNGWKVEIETAAEADMGGFKEISASVSGTGVYGRMKFESGVHRVQRVPVTETQGRIHTSAATVAVLPEVEDIDIDFNMNDVRVDTMRASGAGGQHVNKTDSAVRMTHEPTGVVVLCDAKSQHQNRANAERLLKMKLYDMEKARQESERAEERAGQVGSGDRSERIRTYNYPQGRVTDHRINLTLYNLDKIVAGDALDEVIGALITEDQAAKLAQMQ
ncbi:peptide chain release factor 1 [Algimonas porphyrae]|uniref:Peptide chain release factor 1 n=1 Tax=Algimonas porphyrae TaxID=1128113 RepID=A0ABQ5UWW9_9PROT|nr:peptide chain release factor 1 [Algimonas porphyrae]GLQ19800.1 peptide chain release factor 1 [Algimonas porphyrae]